MSDFQNDVLNQLAHALGAAAQPAGAEPKPILHDYLSDPELCAELGICYRTLARWRAQGQAPPHVQFGRRNKTHRGVAREWVDRGAGR